MKGNRFRVPMRWLRVGLAMLLVCGVVASGVALAAGGAFTDDETSIFEPDINWMAASGVTLGCGGTNYCPDQPVTRGQMAAFMHRLAIYFGMEDGATDNNPAYSTWNDGPISLPGASPVTVLTLAIPEAGSYVITAKLWLDNTSGSIGGVLMDCRLTAGGDWDRTRLALEPNGANADEAAAAFNVVHTYPAPGTATLTCNDFGVNDVLVYDAKITAIKVGALTNVPG